VKAMAEGNILQMVVFSVFFALALLSVKDRAKPVLHVLEGLSEVVFKLVNLVMVFAPLGVFGAIAAVIAKSGFGVLLIYAKLVGCLYLALGLFMAVVLFPMCQWAGLPLTRLLVALKEPLLLAFTTSSSESAMPQAIKCLEKLGLPNSVVSFVLPTGYSFNLDGSTLYLSLATLFVAQLANIQLSWDQQLLILLSLLITSKGVAAVPRTSLVILTATLAAFKLPVEGVGVILGIDFILDMGRTTINLLGNCVASAVIAKWEGVSPFGAKKPDPAQAAVLALGEKSIVASGQHL
jgi:proton glutamate symport protein